MGRECGACDSYTLGLGPPRANFIWQLSLPVASTVARRNVCLTSIGAIRSLALGIRPKSERNYSRSAMGLPSAMGDEHVVSQARRSGHRLAHAIGSNVTRSYLRTLDAGTQTTRYRVVGVICLRRDRRQRGRASQGRGVIPVESSPRIWKPRAVGDRRGASALGATIAVRHDDASPHKWGGGREHGHRRWKRRESAKDWP